MLGGVLLSGASRFGADEPPLSVQLLDLGKQALSQGASRAAEKFFLKSLELDPANQSAKDGLDEIKRSDRVVQVAMQEPKEEKPAEPAAETPPPPAPGDVKATLEQTKAAENIQRQELTDNVEQRLKTAQRSMHENQPEAAMNALRLALNVIRSSAEVPEDTRTKLERRVQAELMSVCAVRRASRGRTGRAHPARRCR